MWHLRQNHDYMDKAQIEEVAERVGMDREQALEVFLRLAGQVWAGELLPAEGPPITVSAPRTEAPPWEKVIFNRVWFRKRGKLDTSDPD